MSGVFIRTVGRDEGGMRLDRWFKINYPDLAFGHCRRSCAADRCGSTASA